MSGRRSASRSQRTALLGLGINIALALVKLVAGIVGHSYALIADAFESTADIVGSVVIWGGLHVGARPADTNHPYGHGKAEALAALVVAGLVGIAGIGIAIKAVDEIRTPHHTPAPFTLVVLVAVVIVKYWLARYTARVGHEVGSDAVHVDAGHHLSDALTSGAAFIGISVALIAKHRFGQSDRWASADDWAALFAGGVILYNAWKLMRIPLRELMDEEPAAVLDLARETAMSIEGVRGIEKTRARSSGSRHYLELHVEVDPSMSVADAHIITGKIKHAIRQREPRVAEVLVHIEPFNATCMRHSPPATQSSCPP